MKVKFLGMIQDAGDKQQYRKHHQDWAIEIITETDFEQSFLQALFSSKPFHPGAKTFKQMQPIAALLSRIDSGLTIMVSAENFCESELVKARERIAVLEEALNKKG